MPSSSPSFDWDWIKIFAVIILTAISAFASSSETAFFSLNRFQLRAIRDRYRPSYDRIRALLTHPSRLLVLILLINEVVNVSISTLITEIIQVNVPHALRIVGVNSFELSPNQLWFATTVASLVVSVPVLVLFGEITPKVVAARMSRFVAMLNARILMPLYRLLFPILWLADTAISTMLRKLKAEGRDHLSKVMSTLSEDDFMLLMEEGHREGTVDPRERKLITNVFEFDDSTVSEVMTPINQAFCVAATDKVGDVLPEIRLQKYSRIPVVQKGRKNVLGILYVKDLLQLKNHPKLGEIEVRTLMAPPMIVGSNVHLSVLFRRFKEAKSHMAVVVVREPSPAVPATSAAGIREGEVLGIVTMDDVLESIFGAIPDERDVR